MNKDVLQQGVLFALQEPEHVANPYPFYHRLRSEAPFYWDFVFSGWFLTRYADVRAALVDPRLSTKNFPFDASQLPEDLHDRITPLLRVLDQVVLHGTASAHERLRRPLNRAFHPSTFEQLRPGLESLADELLAQGERRSSMDLVTDYAGPLADYMIGELLGLPPNDRAELIKDCDRIRNFVTAQRLGRETVSRAKGAAKSFEAVRASMRPLITYRRKNFTRDLIGQVFATEENEMPFSEEEVLANCVFFLHAGARNAAAAITNAVLVLLRHPEQFASLCSNPDLLPIAIEELLRYEPPLHVVTRGVPEEMEFADRRIGPGQRLVLFLGAANRDPEQFADPDRLDLTRRPNRHVSFGVGPHGCVGAWLARFGMAIALGAIVHRPINLRLARGKLDWNFPAMRRTVRALPVLVETRGQRSRPRPARTARLCPQ